MNQFVGADIGGTKMHLIAGEEGAFIERRVPTGPRTRPGDIRSALHDFLAGLPFPVSHVGMTIPGMISADGNEVLLVDQMLGLTGMTAEGLSPPGCRVHFIGDLPAAALWETSFYPPDQTVLVVMAGTGVAMSGQLAGDPPRMIGSDMGYAPIHTRHGVYLLNELVGGYAMLRGSREEAGAYLSRLARREPEPTDEEGNRLGSVSGEEFRRRLDAGDEKTLALVADAGYYLGLALSSLVVHFFPRVIVVGGGATAYPGLVDRAFETARRYTLAEYMAPCTLTGPRGDGRRTAALGARLHAMHKAGAARPHILY